MFEISIFRMYIKLKFKKYIGTYVLLKSIDREFNQNPRKPLTYICKIHKIQQTKI